MTLEQVEAHAEGLVCLSGCARDGALAGAWERGETARGARLGRRLLRGLRPRPPPGRAAAPLLAPRPRPQPLARPARRAARRALRRDRQRPLPRPLAAPALQDAFVAVRLGTTLEASEPRRRGNSSSALSSPAADGGALRRAPRGGRRDRAPRRAAALRPDRGARLPLSRLRGPERRPRARRASAGRGWPSATRARPQSAPRPRRRLEQELATIRNLGLSGFFLLHRDLLELAREVALEVRGPGVGPLGPAAGPRARLQRQLDRLLPDRPLPHRPGRERTSSPAASSTTKSPTMPDIDLDFPRDIREVLIPRVHERYGARPLGPGRRLPDLPPARRGARPRQGAGAAAGGDREGGEDRSASTSGRWRSSATSSPRSARERAASPRWRALLWLCGEAMGLPRHASQHPGGMVISTRPLIDVCPVVPAAMEGRQIVQWDKDSCSDAGFLKIDLLGLGMLSAVERCVEEVGRTRRDERLDLSRIDLDDEQTFESIQRGGDDRRLPDREPRADADAAAHPARRTSTTSPCRWRWSVPARSRAAPSTPTSSAASALREDPEFEIPYEHPLLEPALEDTLGTIVYQEQVLEVAMALAGFSSARGRGAAPGDEPQALAGGDRARTTSASSTGPRSSGVDDGDRASGSGSRSRASRASASRRRTRPPSACSPTSRPGCGCTAARSSSARCSTSSRWASTRPTRWSTRRSGAGCGSPAPTPTAAASSARSERERGRPGRADRPRLRQGGARGGDGEPGRRARARRSLPRDRRPRLALGRRARRARTAGLGGGAGRDRRLGVASAGRGRREALWQVGVAPTAAADAAEGTQLALPLEPPRAAGAGAARRTGRR